MALNQYMHPRNIYKTPPDFAKLAKEYKEFSDIVKMDISGKVTIDFKDPTSLRILTKCLLKSDFNLDIDIPENRLVPTLPLRLNYILWIEDLLNSIGGGSSPWGIDIGTGACAIYPVLTATQNKWSMIGTEADEESLLKARENIERNNLQNLIKLSKAPKSSLIGYVMEEYAEQNFDFCMCNPPFYCSVQELCDSRNPTRHPPKNGFTGSQQELITEGGELEFCRKLIDESKSYKNRLRFFTTMIGHKYNLKELLHDLSTEGIKYTHTEFCQGRVTRWGLAWTYQNYDILSLVPPRDRIRKKNTPTAYLLPSLTNLANDLESYFDKLKSIFNTLHLEYKILNKRFNSVSLQITALRNTWSNQRRKRRLLKRISEQSKKIKLCNEEDCIKSTDSCVSTGIPQENIIFTADKACNNNIVEEIEDIHPENDQEVASKVPIVNAFMKILKKDNDILFEVEFISGSAGKEGMHQIIQYIKNNWK